MARADFKFIPETANNAEICRYINTFIEELNYTLRTLDDENTNVKYATEGKSNKDIERASRYSATERDLKLKALEDGIRSGQRWSFSPAWSTGTKDLTGCIKYRLFRADIEVVEDDERHNYSIVCALGNWFGDRIQNHITGSFNRIDGTSGNRFYTLVIDITNPAQAGLTAHRAQYNSGNTHTNTNFSVNSIYGII